MPDDLTDGATDGVQPWPRWVRYPLIAVALAVVVVGLVLALTSGVDSAVWRVVIAAVLIPALLAPVQLWGLLRRSRRLGARLDEDLGRLQERIARERDVDEEWPAAGTTGRSLVAAAEAVAAARDHLAAGHEREAAERVQAWSYPWTGALGDELARSQSTARAIARTGQRAGRSNGDA